MTEAAPLCLCWAVRKFCHICPFQIHPFPRNNSHSRSLPKIPKLHVVHSHSHEIPMEKWKMGIPILNEYLNLPCLWNKLPVSFRQPHPGYFSSHSSHSNHLSTSLTTSPLSMSNTFTVFPLETQNVLFPQNEILPIVDTASSIGLPSRTPDCSVVLFYFFHLTFSSVRAQGDFWD